MRRTASALVRAGLAPGDVVTMFAPNLPEYAIVYLAVIAMGGVVSCLNPLYTPGEKSVCLVDYGFHSFPFNIKGRGNNRLYHL